MIHSTVGRKHPLSHREPSRHLWPMNSHVTGCSLHKQGFGRLKDLTYWRYIRDGSVLRACVVKKRIPQHSSCLSGFEHAETDGLQIKTFAERWFCFVWNRTGCHNKNSLSQAISPFAKRVDTHAGVDRVFVDVEKSSAPWAAAACWQLIRPLFMLMWWKCEEKATQTSCPTRHTSDRAT